MVGKVWSFISPSLKLSSGGVCGEKRGSLHHERPLLRGFGFAATVVKRKLSLTRKESKNLKKRNAG